MLALLAQIRLDTLTRDNESAAQVASLLAQVQELQNQLEAAQIRLARLQQLQSQMETTESELEVVKSWNFELERLLIAARVDLQATQGDLQSIQESTSVKIGSLESDLLCCRDHCQDLAHAMTELEHEKCEAYLKVDELEQEREQWMEQLRENHTIITAHLQSEQVLKDKLMAAQEWTDEQAALRAQLLALRLLTCLLFFCLLSCHLLPPPILSPLITSRLVSSPLLSSPLLSSDHLSSPLLSSDHLCSALLCSALLSSALLSCPLLSSPLLP